MTHFYQTVEGTLEITLGDDLRYQVTLDGEWLGTYDDQEQALEALRHGDVFQPKARTIEFDMLEIPDSLLDWHYVSSSGVVIPGGR